MRARSLIPVFVVWLVSLNAVQAERPVEQAPHVFPEYSDAYTENALAPVLKPGRVLYVDADGSDQNPGTRDSPLRSLEAARDRIRRLKATSGMPGGGVHVVLLPGNYQRNESFRLSAEDSGTADCPVVYRGTTTSRVVLTGGVPLDTSRFTLPQDPEQLDGLPEAARGNVMRIDLSDDDLADYFPGDGKYGQISMDGHLLQLAQWPNRGYHHIGEIIDAGPATRWLKPGEKPASYSKPHPTGGVFVFREAISPAVQAEFERTGDMRVQGYLHNDWYFQNEPLGGIDGDAVQLLRYTRYGIADKIKSIPRRVRLVNVLAELDEVGEWYFDRDDQRLYVWPVDGFEPGVSRVTVLGGQPLIQCQDTAYVTFRDLTFENTGNLAVEISGGEHNLLARSVVRNGAGRGLSVNGGKYNGVTGCEFYGLHTAFHLSGGNKRTLEPCFHFATNNIIHDCRRRGYGLIGLTGVGLRFAHNLLYNLNGAIHFRTVNLLLEYNEFFHIGYEMGDFNVAYCGAQWYTMNNVIRYNFVHHLLEPGGYPVMAFRNDDGGAGLKIYGNVFYRSGRGGGQFHGPLNDFQNNITIDSPVMWWTQKKSITPEAIQKQWDDLSRFGRDLPRGDKGDFLHIMERTLGEKGWLKSPWKDAFPELARAVETNPWAQTFCNVNRNYICSVREPFHIHGASGTVEGMESVETGRFADLPPECNHELPWPITLDAFVDVPSLDLRFKEGFQVQPGFCPIPFERIGLVDSDSRPRRPDKVKYRRSVFQRFQDDRSRGYDAQVVNARYPKPTYLDTVQDPNSRQRLR